jgi:hypothetical protein
MKHNDFIVRLVKDLSRPARMTSLRFGRGNPPRIGQKFAGIEKSVDKCLFFCDIACEYSRIQERDQYERHYRSDRLRVRYFRWRFESANAMRPRRTGTWLQTEILIFMGISRVSTTGQTAASCESRLKNVSKLN